MKLACILYSVPFRTLVEQYPELLLVILLLFQLKDATSILTGYAAFKTLSMLPSTPPHTYPPHPPPSQHYMAIQLPCNKRWHADPYQHISAASQDDGDDEHLREGRVQRKLHHVASQWCQWPGVVQRSQHPQLVHGVHDVVLQHSQHGDNTAPWQHSQHGDNTVSMVTTQSTWWQQSPTTVTTQSTGWQHSDSAFNMVTTQWTCWQHSQHRDNTAAAQSTWWQLHSHKTVNMATTQSVWWNTSHHTVTTQHWHSDYTQQQHKDNICQALWVPCLLTWHVSVMCLTSGKGERSQHVGVWLSTCGRKSMKRKVREANMWVHECLTCSRKSTKRKVREANMWVCGCLPVMGDPWRERQEKPTCGCGSVCMHAIMCVCVCTCGGGSMKWNVSRSTTPSDFSSSTTLARLVRWISGTVAVSSSSLYWRWVYSRYAWLTMGRMNQAISVDGEGCIL